MDWIADIKKGESKILELKEQLPQNNSIAKTVIAFANTAGGRLIIGVDDSLDIVGIDEESIFQIQEKLSSLIYDLCHPNIIPEIYTIRVESKTILVTEIFRGNLLPYWLKPKGLQDGTYIRIGSSNRVADEQMIQELQRYRMHTSFDEEANMEYGLEDLEIDIIYDAFSKISKICDMEKLKNLKLISLYNDKYIPSNALLITLGRLDNVQIKCARFKGTTMESFIDKKEFDGTLFDMLEKSMEFLQNHLHLSATIEGLQRTERHEIPLPALREIILNAIIHRDYTRNSDIKIAIYDDIVEIISVGGLVNGLTIDDMGNGRSELRNKVLANLFRELGYIESWGSGIGRVQALCGDAKVNLELKEQGSFVSVIFHRPSIEKVSNSIETVDYGELPPNTTELLPNNYQAVSNSIGTVDYGRLRSITVDSHQAIVTYIVNNGQITRKATMDLLSIGRTKADEILSCMSKDGLIVRKGAGRATHYLLIAQREVENNQ